jgi:hypothetical protein
MTDKPRKNQYVVEIFVDNEWKRHSWHTRENYATINAETISKSRKCPARIIHGGKIIKEVGLNV